MGSIKNWLIRRLGGYTFYDMHFTATKAAHRELWVQWVMTNLDMSGDDVVAATNYVVAHSADAVDLYFSAVVGYRGNKPEGK